MANRSKQNLSNYKLTTADMGELIPVQLQEVLPGDTMKLSTSALIRVSPMLAPVMHPCTVRFHHWFVPTRLLWDGWEDFITGGPDNDNADTVPTLQIPVGGGAGQIPDYMGVPTVPNLEVNALPIRAYNLIYNEFYRDQDLVNPISNMDNTAIRKVAWRKDYFTTARPWTQKGSDIQIPLGASAPVTGTISNPSVSVTSNANFRTDVGSNLLDDLGSSGTEVHTGTQGDSTHSLVADLTQATGVTANEFRELFALQRYAEARAQYGSRYSEYLRYLGVKPSDARLQRPEYLGGGKSTLQFSEVVQTGADSTSPEDVGQLRGHGITALKTRNTKKFFEEHGYMITLMSVVPKSIYQDGLHRTWLRQDKEDFYQKELQNIGQQAIKQGEIDATDPTTTHDTFGYSDRYADYRSTPSTVSGQFRTTLDFWHLARKFETPPLLNQSFIECVPSKRIHAVQSEDVLWCMVNNSCVARRMVSNNTKGILR
ncbi:major capsid protein [Sulfurovum sp.]|uniref:major capsid protein n=1 Tax=Sulfurovum sp. TaxID=1969726 RepID=UPI003567F730